MVHKDGSSKKVSLLPLSSSGLFLLADQHNMRKLTNNPGEPRPHSWLFLKIIPILFEQKLLTFNADNN
ncbi:hypothetical protein BST85_03550 [Aureitalea marina]|uniref:Uncharacterized protein n=1 Tax=Aureitalea marina TaxID=930804 RepID=A0A2S7KN70_9FLAO|nr:hypothetical protein BST85_03550 [Aureitalea marina]